MRVCRQVRLRVGGGLELYMKQSLEGAVNPTKHDV
jgi:hypothetical protein